MLMTKNTYLKKNHDYYKTMQPQESQNLTCQLNERLCKTHNSKGKC